MESVAARSSIVLPLVEFRSPLRIFHALGLVLLASSLYLDPPAAQAEGVSFSNTIAHSYSFITNIMAEHEIPGCTIVLVDGQDIVWAEGFGVADKDTLAPVTTNTVMAIGHELLWFGGYRCNRLEDLPVLENKAITHASASMHENAQFIHADAAAGSRIAVMLCTNAPQAEISIFSLATTDLIARGNGLVEWESDGDTALLWITSPDEVHFQIKAVDLTEVREAMQRTLAQYPYIPGFGISAQEPGFPPIILTEGYARISPPSEEPSLPLQGHEQFHIASISKTYTAAAIFLLQQRGLLNIENSVTNYAPELNIPRGDEITIEMLLQHRSGLPFANDWFNRKLIEDPLLEFSVEEIVDVANWHYPNLMFEPGEAWSYTDTGYNILARVIENVSETNYQAFINDDVLLPLGLTNTFAPYNHEVEVPEPSVSSYMLMDGEFQDRSVWNPSVEFGCGSVISTLEDLMNMTHGFFMTTNLLDETTHALMMDKVSPGFDPYGRGCNWTEGLGWGHDGTMWGAISTARVDTNNGVRVAAVMNGQYEDERMTASFFAIRSALGLLKNALGYDAGTLGREEPIVFPMLGPTRQGNLFRYQPLSFNFPTNWIVTGLPDGMTYDLDTGEISGATYLRGNHALTVTTQNAYGSVEVELELEVKTGYTNTIAVISQMIADAMELEETIGVSIALVDDQEMVWAEGFGYADLEAGLPVTPESVFHIGSVSKAFTSAATLQYAERGLLDIFAPFTNYTPDVSWRPRYEDARPITSFDLMTHHSGLPGDLIRAGFLTAPLDKGYENTVYDLAHTYPILPPGIVNNYCNVGFVLLEGVIESAAANEGVHGTFAQLVDERIFSPLSMDATSYVFDKPAIVNNLAWPYQGGERMPHEFVDILGTGSMYSTPSDLAQFIKALFSDAPVVLRPETRDFMLADHSTNAVFDHLNWFKSGLGWDTVSDPRFEHYGIKACWKSGGTLAYAAMMTILPEEKLGVAIIASAPSAIPTTLDSQTLLHALMERDQIELPPPERHDSPEVVVPQDDLDALAGFYAGSAGYDIVEAHPGSLTYRINVPEEGLVVSNLTLREHGWLVSDDVPHYQIAFTNVHGRDLVRYKWIHDEIAHDGIFSERFTPPAELSAAWSNRLGKTWIARNAPVNDYMPLVGIGPELYFHKSNGIFHVLTSGLAAGRALEPDLENDDLAWTIGLVNRGDSAVQVEHIEGIEHIRYMGYLFGPAPEELPVATSITGSIERDGFARWYAIQPANPAAPQGGISNVLYKLNLSAAPPNFLLRIYEADGATPVASRRGTGTLKLESGNHPLLFNIQPDTDGDQTGLYDIGFNIPLLIREIEMADTGAIVWQGPTGTTYAVEAAPFLAPYETFAPVIPNILGTNLLQRWMIPIPNPDPSRFYRINSTDTALGNNDTFLGDYDIEPAGDEFYHATAELFYSGALTNLLSFEQFRATYTNSGAYSTPFGEGQIITLQTLYFSIHYTHGSEAGSNQLAYLEAQLQNAEAEGRPAWILLHIPPGVNSYETWQEWSAGNTNVVHTDWVPSFIHSFCTIVSTYSNTVAGLICGHYHNRGWQLISDPVHSNALATLQIANGLLYNHGNNPGFTVLTYNRATFDFVIENTYSLCVQSHTGELDPTVPWSIRFSQNEGLRVADLTPASLEDAWLSMREFNTPSADFYNREYSGGRAPFAMNAVNWPVYYNAIRWTTPEQFLDRTHQ